jgi:uncharacterized membrane protein (UPF0136 family)
MKLKQISTIIFGLTAIGVGLWRHFEAGSPAALWFGIVMGSIAITGALLLKLKTKIPGYILIWLALCFVVGFFIHRTVSKGADEFTIRVAIILAMSAVELVVMLLPVKASNLTTESTEQS